MFSTNQLIDLTGKPYSNFPKMEEKLEDPFSYANMAQETRLLKCYGGRLTLQRNSTKLI